VVSPTTLSVRIFPPLMNVVETIAPAIPIPLPTMVDLTVTSAHACDADTVVTSAIRIRRFM